MEHTELLDKTLRSFRRYYNINTEDAKAPFAAEAVYHSHDEQYFLVRSATISESDSNEHVFFATEDHLSSDKLRELDEQAWQEGLNRVQLREGHKSTDVALIILANTIAEDAKKLLPKTKHYKSYAFTLKGWSNYRLIALEVSTGQIIHNRQGGTLKKLLLNVIQ